MLVRVCDSVKNCTNCLNFDGFLDSFYSVGNKCLTCGDSRKIEINPRYIPIKDVPSLTKEELAAIAPRGDYEE